MTEKLRMILLVLSHLLLVFSAAVAFSTLGEPEEHLVEAALALYVMFLSLLDAIRDARFVALGYYYSASDAYIELMSYLARVMLATPLIIVSGSPLAARLLHMGLTLNICYAAISFLELIREWTG